MSNALQICVETILKWAQKLPNNGKMSLKVNLLSHKLTMLLLLESSQKGQTVLNLNMDRLRVEEGAVLFKVKTLLKHNWLAQP